MNSAVNASVIELPGGGGSIGGAASGFAQNGKMPPQKHVRSFS
jgi:hypothetical protein